MKAARWYGRDDLRVEETAEPDPPAANEVQLRVLWCGICATDIEEWSSGPVVIPTDIPHPLTGMTAPLTLGHEFSGVVERVGDAVSSVEPAQRVVCSAVQFCHTCRWCRHGLVNRCVDRAVIGLHRDGGLAEYCNVPDYTCFPVAEQVPDDVAPLIETLAVAVRALKRGRIEDNERVLIVGAGPVGQLAAQAARVFGAEEVHVIDPDPRRRALALKLGADSALDVSEQIESIDLAIESAGTPDAVVAAVGSLDIGGRCVIVGVDQRPVQLETLPFVLGERELLGSIAHIYDSDFRTAVRLMANNEVNAAELLSDRIPLDDVVENGFRALRDRPGDFLKIVVTPRSSSS